MFGAAVCVLIGTLFGLFLLIGRFLLIAVLLLFALLRLRLRGRFWILYRIYDFNLVLARLNRVRIKHSTEVANPIVIGGQREDDDIARLQEVIHGLEQKPATYALLTLLRSQLQWLHREYTGAFVVHIQFNGTDSVVDIKCASLDQHRFVGRQLRSILQRIKHVQFRCQIRDHADRRNVGLLIPVISRTEKFEAVVGRFGVRSVTVEYRQKFAGSASCVLAVDQHFDSFDNKKIIALLVAAVVLSFQQLHIGQLDRHVCQRLDSHGTALGRFDAFLAAHSLHGQTCIRRRRNGQHVDADRRVRFDNDIVVRRLTIARDDSIHQGLLDAALVGREHCRKPPVGVGFRLHRDLLIDQLAVSRRVDQFDILWSKAALNRSGHFNRIAKEDLVIARRDVHDLHH